MCGADLFGTLPGEASDVTANALLLHEGKSVGRTADVMSNLEAAALFGLAFRFSLQSEEAVISNSVLGRRLDGSYFGQPCFVDNCAGAPAVPKLIRPQKALFSRSVSSVRYFGLRRCTFALVSSAGAEFALTELTACSWHLGREGLKSPAGGW